MKTVTLLSLCLVGRVIAGHSPHGEKVRSDPSTSWYPINILEDAALDAHDLIKKYGYPVETHRVTTSDGYILGMHRIPHGRNQNNDPSVDRPVVFIMHGLLSSSADFVNMGPTHGLGYVLADEGYDVWMGNARGNFYSRNHIRLNPDSFFNRDFWNFSWHEIGHIDVPTMIDYILAHTGKANLHFVGHSQGTTAFFVMASTRPEYNSKIKAMQAMAPVAYMDNVPSLFLRTIARFTSPLQIATSILGLNEFLPNNQFMTWAGRALCYEDSRFSHLLCENIFFLILGMNPDQINATMVPIKLGHTPAGSSNTQFAHYGQLINSGGFRQWDYGRAINLIRYGSFNPPIYPLNRITAPVALHYSLADNFADPRDVQRLSRDLGKSLGLFLVPLPEFMHIDFMWGMQARTLVYDRMINVMKAFD